jgi:hypothetical protein
MRLKNNKTDFAGSVDMAAIRKNRIRNSRQGAA